MADYAGAVAAIKQRMMDNWATTPIAFQNSKEFDPGEDAQRPWVYFEVIGSASDLTSFGVPGDRLWTYTGLILAHVFVPLNSEIELAHQYAVAIGEIFRAQGFYSQSNGSIVRSWAPRTDGGGTDADDGNWFRVTCTIPFEYLHRG